MDVSKRRRVDQIGIAGETAGITGSRNEHAGYEDIDNET